MQFFNLALCLQTGDYREITLLRCVGRLFTAILNDMIVIFLEANNLLDGEQAGLLPATHDWYRSAIFYILNFGLVLEL